MGTLWQDTGIFAFEGNVWVDGVSLSVNAPSDSVSCFEESDME